MPKRRTYSDRAAYIVKAVSKRRKKLREMARLYKGGKCMLCGYSKYLGALDFHHLYPSKKEFGLSMQGLTRSWEKIQVELDKCILICANCHREVHAGITQLPGESLVEKRSEFGEASQR
jgi:5-methylcytosine-specific restriction endonuclease McrA